MLDLEIRPESSASLKPQISWTPDGPDSPIYVTVPWNFPAMEKLLGVELGHINKRQRDVEMPPLTAEMEHKIEQLYSDDIWIWENLNA